MGPIPRSGRSVRVLAVAALATSALFTASGPSAACTQPPVRTGLVAPAAAPTPSRPAYRQLALDTLDEVVQGDFAAVSARFEPALRQQASPQVLEQSWKTYVQEFGDYQSHGEPRQVEVDVGTVVGVPLDMAKKPGEFRVTFDADGRLLGLYFLRPGVPVS